MNWIARIKRWSENLNAEPARVELEIARKEIARLEQDNAILRSHNECVLDQMKLVRSNNASLREALSRPENPPSPRRYTLADLRDEIEALKKTAPRHTAETIKTPDDARRERKKRLKKRRNNMSTPNRPPVQSNRRDPVRSAGGRILVLQEPPRPRALGWWKDIGPPGI